MIVEALPEHQLLKHFLGDWTYESAAEPAPGEDPHRTTGTLSFRPIGDVWVVGEMQEDGDADPQTAVITLGYDPNKKKYVGTFVTSALAELWVYEGDADPDGKAIVLASEGPSMDGNGRTTYRDIYAITGDDTWELRSECQLPSGEYAEFMKATFRRK